MQPRLGKCIQEGVSFIFTPNKAVTICNIIHFQKLYTLTSPSLLSIRQKQSDRAPEYLANNNLTKI